MAGADDAHRNLAAVRDENLLEHETYRVRSQLWRWSDRILYWTVAI